MSTQRTILIIVGSEAVDRGYGQSLQQGGGCTSVLIQSYGPSTAELCRSQPIDGILIDQPAAPDIRTQILNHLTHQLGDRCPPIVMVGENDASTAVQALKDGATDYLIQGQFTPEELGSAMEEAIARVEAKRTLQQSQEQLQTSIETLLDCFGIFSSIRDAAGHIVDFRIDYLNAAACENNRMTREEQVGRRLCDVLPGHRESGLFDEYCRLVETGEPLIKDSLVHDDTYGGHRLIRAFDIRASRLNDGFVASWRDITDRKQLELELHQTATDLRQQQQRLQQLIDTAPIGIGIGSASGEVQVINDAMLRLHHYSRQEFEQQGMNWRDFTPPDRVEHVEQSMARLQKQGLLPPEEKELLRRDGSRVPIWISVTQWMDSPDEHVAFAVDLTAQKAVEAALKASQKRYQDLAEAMPQIVWTADASGMVNYWNHRWYEYTGLGEAQSMGIEGVKTVHPNERERILPLWSQAIAAGEPLELEYRIRRWDGVYHWFICRAIPTRDDHAQVTGWVGTITNINDLKQSEALLRQSQQQLQQQLAEIEAIYQSAPIGLSVLDADLRFVRINQRLAEMNGISVEAHIGRTVRELLPGLADTAEQLLRPILETGEPLLNVEIRGETPAQPGVQRTWIEHFLPLKDGDRVIGISTVCEEVTQRVRIEAILRQSEERFRNMADNAPLMIWVTDATGYCTYLNHRWYEFTGQTEATALGFGWLDAVHPDDDCASRTTFLQANQRQEAFRLEYRLRDRQGNYRWAIDSAMPWFGEDGEFKGYIGSVLDISDRKLAEETLRQSEERYRTLFETMTEGFCIVEMLFDDQGKPWDYRFIEINPVFEQHSGLNQAQGKTARQLLPDLEPHWFEIYGNVALTGQPVRFENGSDVMNRWFGVSAFRIGPPEHHRVAILFRDISERRKAERELQESEARFRTLADNISQFAWMANELGWIFWYNQRWFDYTGTTLEQMQGWGWQQVHHPDYVAQVVSKYRRCIETGETWEDTFPLRGEDGSYRWFLSRAIPVRDEQGRVRRWFGTNTDITDLRQTEMALQQATERLNLALKSAPLTLFNQDLDLRYTWIYNPTQNYSREEVIGRRDEELTSPESASRLTQLKQHVIGTGVGLREEVQVTDKLNQTTYYDLTIDPIRDEHNAIVGITCAAVDITTLKQAEAQRELLLKREQAAREAAERANRIKDEFLAVLSHELRSPLNPILGWTKLLQAQKLDARKTADALTVIERNARLQTQLIDDLLDIAKILRGKLSLNSTLVDLGTVIEAASDTVKTAAAAKSIALNLDLGDRSQVAGDAARLQQTVWNLLSNAIKFTPVGGRVDVRLEQVIRGTPSSSDETTTMNRYAQITVTDTGKGINPDFLPHIFESFRQEDVSTTRKYGGLGLGLAIVRQLVEAHGGNITASSPGEGLGATFTVHLPLVQTETQAPLPQPVSRLELDLTGIRVLVVDDEPDARELLTVLLTQHNADVVAVTSAAEALAHLPSVQPDVLISDIGMPEVDGYTLIRQVRSLSPEQGGRVPAIALTAYARENDQQQALTSGYQRHLTKPLEIEDLIAAVRQLA